MHNRLFVLLIKLHQGICPRTKPLGKYFPLLTGTSTFPRSSGKDSLLCIFFFNSFLKRFLYGVSLSRLFRWCREWQLFFLCLPYLWQKCTNVREKQGFVPALVLPKSHHTWYKTPCSSLGLGKFSLSIFLSGYTSFAPILQSWL